MALLNLRLDGLKTLLEYTKSTKPNIFTPAIRCLGNITSSNEGKIIDELINLGLFDVIISFIKFIEESDNSVKLIKEVFWLISNIAAGVAEDVEAVVNDQDLMKKIYEYCFCSNADVRKEATWVLCNMVTGANKETLEKLIFFSSGDILIIFIKGLSMQEQRFLNNLLESIEKLLNLDRLNGWTDAQSVCTFFENNNGLEVLEETTKNGNYAIYEKSMYLIQEYFS